VRNAQISQGYLLTTVSEEIVDLRVSGRNIRASNVICAPDDIVVLGAYRIMGKVAVYDTCVVRTASGERVHAKST
jgi:hypothetical protein